MIVRIAREGDEVEGGRMRVRMGASIRDRIPSTLIHNEFMTTRQDRTLPRFPCCFRIDLRDLSGLDRVHADSSYLTVAQTIGITTKTSSLIPACTLKNWKQNDHNSNMHFRTDIKRIRDKRL